MARVVDPGNLGMKQMKTPQSMWLRIIRGLLRLVKLSIMAVPLATMSTVQYFMRCKSLEERLWRYAIWSIEEAGPTFVKFAQWAANRNDLFPEVHHPNSSLTLTLVRYCQFVLKMIVGLLL